MRGQVCQPVLEKDPGLIIITRPFKCSTLKVDLFFFFFALKMNQHFGSILRRILTSRRNTNI